MPTERPIRRPAGDRRRSLTGVTTLIKGVVYVRTSLLAPPSSDGLSHEATRAGSHLLALGLPAAGRGLPRRECVEQLLE